MATKTQVPVEEYLRTSFAGPDREYLNGAIVERSMGSNPHSKAQGCLTGYFYNLRSRFPLHIRPEIRMHVGEQRYRVADVAVYEGEEPQGAVPAETPLVTIEILSPDDRMSETLMKLSEYRAWGVRHVWLVDPETRSLYTYGDSGLRETDSFQLPEYGVRITLDDVC